VADALSGGSSTVCVGRVGKVVSAGPIQVSLETRVIFFPFLWTHISADIL